MSEMFHVEIHDLGTFSSGIDMSMFGILIICFKRKNVGYRPKKLVFIIEYTYIKVFKLIPR